MANLLTLSAVTFAYKRRAPVLAGVTLELQRGQTIAVTGRTGSGKSTIAALAAGLVRPRSGRVTILGKDLNAGSRSNRAAFRRDHIGMIFQAAELIPTLNAVENVALPALLAGTDFKTAQARATDLLGRLAVEAIDTPSETLSGGEAQRVGVARALINSPELVIADEPTASLDGTTRDRVADLMFETCREHNAGLLVVTHDPSIAARTHRVVDLSDGRLRSTDLAPA